MVSPTSPPALEVHRIPRGSWCPNNPRLPVLIYRNLAQGSPEDLAQWFEATFAAQGWPPAWRYTIYDYPHYHSTSHEVIGIFRGRARVRLGDDVGLTVDLHAGDGILLPAGVSHERQESSPDFQGVGAYPHGFEVDQQTLENHDRAGSERRIAALPCPDHDPFWEHGPMLREWRTVS